MYYSSLAPFQSWDIFYTIQYFSYPLGNFFLFDGFWEQNLKPWDTAAGFLIAEEAGAKVTDFSGNTFKVEKNEILVTNQKIHEEMIKLLSL